MIQEATSYTYICDMCGLKRWTDRLDPCGWTKEDGKDVCDECNSALYMVFSDLAPWIPTGLTVTKPKSGKYISVDVKFPTREHIGTTMYCTYVEYESPHFGEMVHAFFRESEAESYMEMVGFARETKARVIFDAAIEP